jgi:hypothetical protein
MYAGMLSIINLQQITMTDIIPHLPIAFLFGTIILYNIIFGYILITDCLFNDKENYELEHL